MMLPKVVVFSFFFLLTPNLFVTERISAKLGHIFTYHCCLKNLVRTPPGIYPTWAGGKNCFFGTDFELSPNIPLIWNMISTIEKKLVDLHGLPYMPPNLVNFGPEIAENGWRVFAHLPKFSHWETLLALPHGRYITDSRQTLARVM